MIKRMLSMALCAALVSASFIGSGASAFAAEQNLTATRGVYYFDTHEAGTDFSDTYIYDDELLKGDSLEYNQKLATMTFELAVASMSSEREPRTDAGYANKSRNLRAYLEDNGFVDFETNQFYKERMTTESMGAACAHKKIVDNGKEYTLLVIAPRSAGYEAEWGSNFVVGKEGDSAGFKNGKDIVLNHAKYYIDKYGIKGDIKVWIAGYSRGAGVVNQIGAALINQPQYYLGENVSLEPRNLYCYTFGTPRSASTADGTEGTPSDSRFDYIHNTFEDYDFVTTLPPQGFGLDRYGKTFRYAKEENKERMLKLLQITNPILYKSYTSVGDPDGFEPKTIDFSSLIWDKQLKLIKDNDPYLKDENGDPMDQRDFLKLVSDSLHEAARTADTSKTPRVNYSEKYENALKHFCGYYYSHLDRGSDLFDGIKNSRYTTPLLAFMYISYMTERYKNTNFDDATKEQIIKAISNLEGVIAEYEVGGEDVPVGLKEDLAELRSNLQTYNNWGAAVEITQTITALLYSEVISEGLIKAGLDKEDHDWYEAMISLEDSTAMTRLMEYLFLYDKYQTSPEDKLISFTTVSKQMKHMATFIGNFSSYMRPHYNEVIISWLRTLDPNYDDFVKENDAQKAGYRRAYIRQPAGVNVTATVRDESGNVAAVMKNGVLSSRTDKWIGVTTSDNGNWLRLPVDKTYRIELSADKAVSVDLKASEFDAYEGREVRTVTEDKKYKWTGLRLEPGVKTTWVISAVASPYKLASDAYYYIEKTDSGSPVLLARGISKGKTKAEISWNGVSGADRYVIYLSKCNLKNKKNKLKKVRTVSARKLKWVKKGLKKNTCYKFRVAAQKKVNGRYTTIATSRVGHIVTGNRKGKYTNPKSLKLSVSSVTLSPGSYTVIKASIKKAVAKKKLLSAEHAAKLRFRSDNPSVAKVDKKGVVTAVASGSCTVYVQTVNGIWKSVRVTVK